MKGEDFWGQNALCNLGRLQFRLKRTRAKFLPKVLILERDQNEFQQDRYAKPQVVVFFFSRFSIYKVGAERDSSQEIVPTVTVKL